MYSCAWKYRNVDAAAVTGTQRMVRDGDRHTGAEQNQRVDQRQTPRRHDAEGTTHLLGTIAAAGTPRGGVVTPQELVGQYSVTGTAKPRQRIRTDVEQRAEERTKKHHFGKNEPQHAHAKRCVHLVVVAAGQRLVDHRAEPAEKHAENAKHADRQHDLAKTGVVRAVQRIHPVRGTKHRNEHDQGGHDRPITLDWNKVNVVLLTHGEPRGFPDNSPRRDARGTAYRAVRLQ